jgi:hypothetical protein
MSDTPAPYVKIQAFLSNVGRRQHMRPEWSIERFAEFVGANGTPDTCTRLRIEFTVGSTERNHRMTADSYALLGFATNRME